MNLILKPDVKYPDTHLDFRSPLNDLKIDIKWDGCVNIDSSANGFTVDEADKDDCHCYLHICDLPEFIAQLQQVLEEAKQKGFEL